jgi:hypothetical protein
MSSPSAPSSPYRPESDVVSFSASAQDAVVAEVFVRPEGTFGYRYSAWVAWRDAGDAIASESWHCFSLDESLITDSVSQAQAAVRSFLQRHGVEIQATWSDA